MLYDLLFAAGVVTAVVAVLWLGWSACDRRVLPTVAGAGLLALGVGGVCTAVELRADAYDQYRNQVTATLLERYGAEVTEASSGHLPLQAGHRSYGPVTLKVDGKHTLCQVETGTGPTDVIAVCDGHELPRSGT